MKCAICEYYRVTKNGKVAWCDKKDRKKPCEERPIETKCIRSDIKAVNKW